MTKGHTERCEVLSDFFSSDFTQEQVDDIMSGFSEKCEFFLNAIQITEDIVVKKMFTIKVDKSQGSDGVNPRVHK